MPVVRARTRRKGPSLWRRYRGVVVACVAVVGVVVLYVLLVGKITQRFGEDLTGRRFAMWGLAFKPNTDDMRDAPSRVVVAELLRRGATVTAYDPVAMQEAERIFGDTPGINYAGRPKSALEGADALVIVTEWKEFRSPDFDAIKTRLVQPIIFDGRNLYDPALVRSLGIEYFGIGRG